MEETRDVARSLGMHRLREELAAFERERERDRAGTRAL
jgi:hypothetical protein